MHLWPSELFVLLDERTIRLPKWSVRKHRKNEEARYLITDLVIDEASDTVFVVYEQQHTGIRFVRSAEIYCEEVPYSAEQRWPRFIRLS